METKRGILNRFVAFAMETKKEGLKKKMGFLSSNFIKICSNIHRSVRQLLAIVAKFVQPIPIFLAYLVPLDVDVVPIKFHQFLFGE
jgi:hypothetical protein